MSSLSPIPPASPASIVSRIQAGDPTGFADLYDLCRHGLRRYLLRMVGPTADDLLHETVIDAFSAIRDCRLRDPGALCGYVRVIAKRKATHHKNDRMQRVSQIEDDILDQSSDIAGEALRNQQVAIVFKYLWLLSDSHREVLVRFYLLQQGPEEIQKGMNLTPTQFRLIKSRAKNRFAKRVQAILEERGSHHGFALV